MQPTTQVPETALQAQARIQREKAEKSFADAEAAWLAAENAHHAESLALPSYKEARQLFNVREQARLNFNRALEAEDQINGTSYAPRNEVAA